MEASILEGPGSFVWIIITVDFSVSSESHLSKKTICVWKPEGLIQNVEDVVFHLLFIQLNQDLKYFNSSMLVKYDQKT